MKYLTEQQAKGGEILDLKLQITEEIIKKLDRPEQTDIFLVQYVKKLISFIKSKKNWKHDFVSYETDIL